MDKLYKLIDEIREYGENNSVPIMSRDTITTIQNIIKENNVKTILEIGTAIGYSTICFASTGIDKIESIERDEEKFMNNLNQNGIIIIDNLSFHGYVGKSNEIKSRNLRQMVRKIEKFIEYLKENKEFQVEFIEVGDTLGVCKRKNL